MAFSPHQLLCSSPCHWQPSALPLSLQPWHMHGSLAAAWQSGEPAMAAAAFPELSHVQCSVGAVCQGEALPAAGWDGDRLRRGWLLPIRTRWSKLCFLAVLPILSSSLPSRSPCSLMCMRPSTGEQMEEEPSGFNQACSQVGAEGAAGTKDGIAWECLGVCE